MQNSDLGPLSSTVQEISLKSNSSGVNITYNEYSRQGNKTITAACFSVVKSYNPEKYSCLYHLCIPGGFMNNSKTADNLESLGLPEKIADAVKTELAIFEQKSVVCK